MRICACKVKKNGKIVEQASTTTTTTTRRRRKENVPRRRPANPCETDMETAFV